MEVCIRKHFFGTPCMFSFGVFRTWSPCTVCKCAKMRRFIFVLNTVRKLSAKDGRFTPPANGI